MEVLIPHREVYELLHSIANRLSILETKMEAMQELVQKLENQLTWLWRTIIGALVAGAIQVLLFFSH